MRYRSTRVASGLDDTGRDCHSCNGENLKFYLERDTDNSIHTLVDFCYITTHLIDFSSFKMSVSKKVRLLYTVSFLDLFACSMVVPLLSVHLRSLGASHFTIGIMSSLYAGLQLLSSPVIGSWSDIRGHHYVLQFTLIICSILYFVLGASSAISVIMLTRIGLGFLKHTQTLCRTLLTDVVSLKDQLHVQGQIVSYGSVGFILGPAIGGHMAESNNGFYYICCIVMLSYWINFGIVNLFLSDVHEAKHGKTTLEGNKGEDINIDDSKPLTFQKQTSRQEEVFKLDIFQAVTNLSSINWPLYWDAFALKFLLGFSLAIHFQNFSLILKEDYGISTTGIGYAISFQALVGATTGFLTGWIAKFYKHDEKQTRRTFHGFGMLTLSFIISSTAPNLTFLLLCLVPLNASGSLLRITTSEIILQRTNPNQRGSLIGSGQSMSSVARLAAPLCSGLVSDLFGFSGTTVLRIAVPATATVLSLILLERTKKFKKR